MFDNSMIKFISMQNVFLQAKKRTHSIIYLARKSNLSSVEFIYGYSINISSFRF